MATIKDVAKKAGVSISSVSNYLNNRPGLGDETAQRIADAIEELHYVVRNAARDLRSTKSGEIGLIFPGFSEPYMEKLINSIKAFLTHHNRSFFLELTNSDPETESNAVMNALGRNAVGLILYTCQQDNRQLFDQLEHAQIPYVLIDRRPASFDCNFVTCDNQPLFRSLVQAALRRGITRIALILGPGDYEENRRAAAGAQQAAQAAARPIELQLIHTTAIRECGFKAAAQLLARDREPPQLVLTNSFLLAEGIRYAMRVYHLEPNTDVQIICTGDCVHDVFYNDDTIAKTSRSTFEMGEATAKLLLDNLKSPVIFDKKQLVFQDTFSQTMLHAPRRRSTVPAEPAQEEITVLLIDEKSSVESLTQLLKNFYATTHIKVNLKQVQPQKQFDFIENYMRSGSDEIDVFLFDIPWLTYFAARGYLLCLDQLMKDSHMDLDHFIPGILKPFGVFEGKLYALPYLACVQLLYYRRDLFSSKSLRREFERQNMMPLKPPKNWLQFNAIANFFTKKYQSASPVTYGHSMTVSYPENLYCDLLPRLWSYHGSLFNDQQQLQVDTPEFRKAVRSMAESSLYSAPGLFSNKPVDTVADFSGGECAMVYTYNYFALGILDKATSKVYRNYAAVPIPGRPVLSGWSFGIAHNSRHVDAAFRFISWASSEEMAIPQTILGGQSPNVSVYRNYDMASLYPWLPLALREFQNTRARLTPFNARGEVVNEKAAENIIFRHLSMLIERVVEAGHVDEADISQTISELKDNLMDLY